MRPSCRCCARSGPGQKFFVPWTGSLRYFRRFCLLARGREPKLGGDPRHSRNRDQMFPRYLLKRLAFRSNLLSDGFPLLFAQPLTRHKEFPFLIVDSWVACACAQGGRDKAAKWAPAQERPTLRFIHFSFIIRPFWALKGPRRGSARHRRRSPGVPLGLAKAA